MLCAPSRTLLARLLRKLRSRPRRPHDLRRASFHGIIGPLNLQHHHRALFAFQTHRTVGYGFPGLAAILRSNCQPCGDQAGAKSGPATCTRDRRCQSSPCCQEMGPSNLETITPLPRSYNGAFHGSSDDYGRSLLRRHWKVEVRCQSRL